MLRHLLLIAGLCAMAGCHVISPEHLKNAPEAETVRAIPTSTSRAAFATDQEDHLLKAADCLADANNRGAIGHLTKYVNQYPDQIVFRMQLAELLLKEEELAEAHQQFHTLCAHAQEGHASGKKQLVHAHTRLMEIAQLRNDRYHEHLHRGIGLYRIAEQLQNKGVDVDAVEIERMYFKAVTAFKTALEVQTDDARAAWYLHLTWSRLDQPRPAEKCLRQAHANAAFSSLTPAEGRELALACVTLSVR